MISFSTIGRCGSSFRRGSLGIESVQRQFDLHRTLLILIFTALQLSGGRSEAKPSVIAGVQFTDRFAPNALPGFPVGDKVQVFAFIQSSDPVESPTISVAAMQSGTTFNLDFSVSTKNIYPGQHVYSKFINLDHSLVGPWMITPTDSTGIGFSDFTFAFHDREEIGPRMMARIAKRTGLQPEDL